MAQADHPPELDAMQRSPCRRFDNVTTCILLRHALLYGIGWLQLRGCVCNNPDQWQVRSAATDRLTHLKQRKLIFYSKAHYVPLECGIRWKVLPPSRAVWNVHVRMASLYKPAHANCQSLLLLSILHLRSSLPTRFSCCVSAIDTRF